MYIVEHGFQFSARWAEGNQSLPAAFSSILSRNDYSDWVIWQENSPPAGNGMRRETLHMLMTTYSGPYEVNSREMKAWKYSLIVLAAMPVPVYGDRGLSVQAVHYIMFVFLSRLCQSDATFICYACALIPRARHHEATIDCLLLFHLITPRRNCVDRGRVTADLGHEKRERGHFSRCLVRWKSRPYSKFEEVKKEQEENDDEEEAEVLYKSGTVSYIFCSKTWRRAKKKKKKVAHLVALHRHLPGNTDRVLPWCPV